METQLKIEDIDVLMEAMDAWKSRGLASDMMGDILHGLVGDKEMQDKFRIEKEKKKIIVEEKRKREQAKADLIKAKLVLLREEMYSELLPK